MPQTDFPPRRRLPLAFRISLLLMLAAVLPLLITVVFSEFKTRPDLIDQANTTMTADARTGSQRIDAYLKERLLDAETLVQVPTVQAFMPLTPTNPPTPAFLDAAQHATYALAAGKIRDPNYVVWWLFYPNGTPSLSYPPNTQPHHYGQALVPQEQLQEIQTANTGKQAGHAFFSPVYYDPTTQKTFMDIYSPIYQDGKPNEAFLGFMRASLNLDDIVSIVKNDHGFNNSGGSFILDQNGIRIADSDSDQANPFTAVAALHPDVQHLITTENWYGPNSAVTVQQNNALYNVVQSSARENTLISDFTRNGKIDNYQGVSDKTLVVPWTYVVISPSAAITQTADKQLWTTIAVAAIVAVLAAIIGLWISGLITRPIMRSVDQLRENSESLNVLAKKQQSASSEQLWVVDSIQVGLQSLQYYTDATRIAAHKLGEVGMELERNWRRQNIETIKQGLQQVITAANYIEKATHYQGDSSQKLSTAIKVTTQVNEQLADGAISATEAASQLEQVVNDLRSVTGK